jgi:hypothetical protein
MSGRIVPFVSAYEWDNRVPAGHLMQRSASRTMLLIEGKAWYLSKGVWGGIVAGWPV